VERRTEAEDCHSQVGGEKDRNRGLP
jgi:hypothetical protein